MIFHYFGYYAFSGPYFAYSWYSLFVRVFFCSPQNIFVVCVFVGFLGVRFFCARFFSVGFFYVCVFYVRFLCAFFGFVTCPGLSGVGFLSFAG